MPNELPIQKFHVRLLKKDVNQVDNALEDGKSVRRYQLKHGLGFNGALYIAPPNQSPPPWLEFVQTGTRETLRELSNRSNAAVLLIRRRGRIFAFTFGHGRHLIKQSVFEPDFGLRTALNGLQHDSLRSLDTFTLEEQTVHTRTQASRASGIEVFGLDVARDILRAVTGTPKEEVSFQSLSGSESVLAISSRVDFPDLGSLCDEMVTLYRKRTYQEHFSWVDNIRRIRDRNLIEQLDDLLVKDLCNNPSSYLAPPEPIDWAETSGFTYARRRSPLDTDLVLSHYLSVSDLSTMSIEQLKKDRVLRFEQGTDQPKDLWPIYKCLVFEASHKRRRFVFTNGVWFEVERGFAENIIQTVTNLPLATVSLPHIQRLDGGHLEPEPEYNKRVARLHPSMALLDGKTARCRLASSGIEPCDLLTEGRDLIHVKHRKGGSSSLSHLFSQARISAEALVADENFRLEVRSLLRGLRPSWENRIPSVRPIPSEFQIVLAILGTHQNHPANELPFFSQVNLARTSEFLLSRGFRIGVFGVKIEA